MKRGRFELTVTRLHSDCVTWRIYKMYKMNSDINKILNILMEELKSAILDCMTNSGESCQNQSENMLKHIHCGWRQWQLQADCWWIQQVSSYLNFILFIQRLRDIASLFGRSWKDIGHISTKMLNILNRRHSFRLRDLSQAWLDFDDYAQCLTRKGKHFYDEVFFIVYQTNIAYVWLFKEEYNIWYIVLFLIFLWMW